MVLVGKSFLAINNVLCGVYDRCVFVYNENMLIAKIIGEVDSGSGGKRPRAGRPKLGATSKMRSMRLTNDEYDFVRWAVKQYRNNVEIINVELFKKTM